MNTAARGWAVGLAGYCTFINLYSPQALLPLLGEEFHADGFRIRAHHLLGRGHASWSFVHGHFSSRFNDYQPRPWICASGESLDFVSVVLTAHALLRAVQCRLLHAAESATIGRLLYLRALFPGPR